MAEGLHYVTSQRWIWVTLLAASLATLVFFGPMEVLLPYVIRNELGGGAGDYGLVLAADGAGSILASIAVGQRGLPRRYLTVLYAAWGGVDAAARRLRGRRVGLAADAAERDVRRARDDRARHLGHAPADARPGEMLGRVRSVDWFTSVGLAPVSFALTAPAASLLGVHTTLVLAGLVPAVTTVLLFLVFGLRRQQPPLADSYADGVSGSPPRRAAGAGAGPRVPPLRSRTCVPAFAGRAVRRQSCHLRHRPATPSHHPAPARGRPRLSLRRALGHRHAGDLVGLLLVERLALQQRAGRARRGAGAPCAAARASRARRSRRSAAPRVDVSCVRSEVSETPGRNGLMASAARDRDGPIASVMPQRETMLARAA